MVAGIFDDSENFRVFLRNVLAEIADPGDVVVDAAGSFFCPTRRGEARSPSRMGFADSGVGP